MKRYYKYIVIAIASIAVFLGAYIYKWENRKPVLEIDFFSLNKGRSIFITTPENQTILIGGGQNSESIRGITSAMPFYKRKINYVVVPSAVPAQIGGLIEIVNRYEIENIMISKVMATSTVLSQLLREVRKNKIHTIEVERGDILDIENDLKMEILFPYENFKFNKTSLPELGLNIHYGSTSAYFLGNLSKTIQKDISNNFKINESENIVEYYHGMTDSKLFAELLEKINPKYVFSTKEKSMHLVSDREEWGKGE